MKDLLETICTVCNIGKYIETTIMDDINGKLHCSYCNYEIYRWSKND